MAAPAITLSPAMPPPDTPLCHDLFRHVMLMPAAASPPPPFTLLPYVCRVCLPIADAAIAAVDAEAMRRALLLLLSLLPARLYAA